VADFVGSANVFGADVAQALLGKRRSFAVRQENIQVSAAGSAKLDGGLQLQGELLAVQFLGASQRLEVQVGSQVITALQEDRASASGSFIERNVVEPGQPVALQWRAQHMVMLDD